MAVRLRVLGVDPGSRVTGWCVLEGAPSQQRVDSAGVIRCRAETDLATRLAELYRGTEAIVAERRPHIAAVETPFHGLNARSALVLAQARGAILAAIATHEVPVVEYTPATIKRCIVGHGRADKRQVREMVHRLVGLDAPDAPDDLFDAAAVAWCHFGHASLTRAIDKVETTGARR